MPDNAPFLCPRCKVPLKEVRTSGGVFYGCDVCGGRAVTIELLRKRFTPESINPLWLHAMRGEGRVGLPCAVENFLRPLRYLALIALAAFIGDLAHIALDPRSQTPCIGASGGIAGVITFYALNFPRMRLAFLMRWGFVWFRWIRLPAWFVFVLWILFQIIGTLEQKAGMSSVSSAAHLGGAAMGILAWLVWRKPNNESRMLE